MDDKSMGVNDLLGFGFSEVSCPQGVSSQKNLIKSDWALSGS
jgi:hypothetical protein